jgi:hypothetical protein
VLFDGVNDRVREEGTYDGAARTREQAAAAAAVEPGVAGGKPDLVPSERHA